MTELADQELDLLKALANEWENFGPPGFLGTSAIEKELKLAIAETTSIIHSLLEKGIVATDKVDIYAAHLTPEGYAIAKSAKDSN